MKIIKQVSDQPMIVDLVPTPLLEDIQIHLLNKSERTTMRPEKSVPFLVSIYRQRDTFWDTLYFDWLDIGKLRSPQHGGDKVLTWCLKTLHCKNKIKFTKLNK